MLLRILFHIGTLVVAFSFGVMCSPFKGPTHEQGINSQTVEAEVPNRRLNGHTSIDMQVVNECCLKDIRTAQEALTKLSEHAQKLRLGLTVDKTQGSQGVSSATFLEERSKALWDQLEFLLKDPNDERRKLRDLRINLEGLKQHLELVYACCASYEALRPLKHYVHIADLRFQAIQARVSPAFIEGEIDVALVVHETGHSYVLKQELDMISDTSQSPHASNLKLYEDGIPLGPAHAAHVDIRRMGKGRYSHWGDSLYFSSSDNSDPITNKRHYTYRAYSSSAVISDGTNAGAQNGVSLK